MKKTILVITLTSMLAFTSAVVLAQESEQAPQSNTDPVQDQKLAKVDSAADYQKFTAEAERKLSDNQKKIEDLKEKKGESDKVASEAFNEKVLGLEKDHDVLKRKIAQADRVKTSTWTVFKNDFNRDLNALDKALRDI